MHTPCFGSLSSGQGSLIKSTCCPAAVVSPCLQARDLKRKRKREGTRERRGTYRHPDGQLLPTLVFAQSCGAESHLVGHLEVLAQHLVRFGTL
jgi:hypothetical protein